MKLEIAAILTCFNRKEKTICCLRKLYRSVSLVKESISLSVYLTDDGCTDGTADIVHLEFPDVNILKGTGSLYWAGGMRLAWNEALKKHWDYFLLLNDDTFVFDNIFVQFIKMKSYCDDLFPLGALIVGATCNKAMTQTTYGGNIYINHFFATSKRLDVNGKYQFCDFANTNIMFVPYRIVKKIGIFDSVFIHGIADYDYSIIARKNGFFICLSESYWGICENEHNDLYVNFSNKCFAERKKYLYSPVGLAFKDKLYFEKKHRLWRLPLIYISGYCKILLPDAYLFLNRIRAKISMWFVKITKLY